MIVSPPLTEVTTEGHGQLTPMLDQIEDRFGKRPEEHLIDGGFGDLDPIAEAERTNTKICTPPKEEKKQLEAGQDPYARKNVLWHALGHDYWRAQELRATVARLLNPPNSG